MQTVLVTGGAGYIGSVFVRELLKNQFKVVCVDKLDFGGESIIGLIHEPNFIFYNCDINDYQAFDEVLEKHKYDVVVHLAAIVGDPACTREKDLAIKTNWDSSKRLVDRCMELDIKRFVFASTCSNYGKMPDPNEYVTEVSSLAPLSLYAELKVKLEKYILEEIPRNDEFCPVCLRFSTVYGASPRMRFDLTVNEFTKEVLQEKELVVYGEQFWRPYCHVKDFSAAFLAVIAAREEKIAYNVFNVGDTSENYTKQMLVEELQKQFPDLRVKYVKKDEDPRDYRVNSDKIKQELGFSISTTVPEGIAEIASMVKSKLVDNLDSQRYYNIPYAGSNV